jgi:glycine/D-amino acid oxidase-like deaminating enzyme
MSETRTETLEADVAICGAGPVGMALAALLARRGVQGNRIVLIDGKSLGQAISDPRSIALAWGSRLLLDDVGAWPAIGASSTAIHQIHVSRRGHLGRSMMDREEHDLEALGYVARYGDLVDALARACERAGVQVLRPLRVSGIDERADGVALQLDDGRTLHAKVAVQAEGGVFGEQTKKRLPATTARPPSSRASPPARRSRTAPSSASPTKARWPCCRRMAAMATSTRWCGACSRSAPSTCWTWAKTASCMNWARPSASASAGLRGCRRASPSRSA